MDLPELERRIGHCFANTALPEAALTHPSLKPTAAEPNHDYQRLEFLGDAVLQLVVAEELFAKYPQDAEGFLTKARSSLVSRPALAGYARELGLEEHVRTCASVPTKEGAHRDALLEDTFEALIGALYLDGGLDVCRRLVHGLMAPRLDDVAEEPDADNPKGRLQEILQTISPVAPRYAIVSQSGPPHDKQFTAAVTWRKQELGRGNGKSKQAAETDAAVNALESKVLAQIVNERRQR